MVYSPELISEPFAAVPNLKGCDALDESDWSNLYTTPGVSLATCCVPPSNAYLLPPSLTTVTVTL